MENFQGDLTDIFRTSGVGLSQSHDSNNIGLDSSNWEFPISDSLLSSDSDATNLFGDPFCNLRDPLLHELNVASASAGSLYFAATPTPNSTHVLSSITVVDDETTSPIISAGANSCWNKILGNHQKVFEGEELNRSPSHIFSRIQITHNNNPADSPAIASSSSPPQGLQASSMASIDVINTNCSNSCLINNSSPLQISSPRNLSIKRRKSHAKKVVCIPAPAVANSRPSGEVVPSDLWAWRKYGQKPIKGSPYPRGYYRCSSSKGCSARKQVERSRTDPKLLVITYTSEHNHPWPTQRNALAGSTRSQPPKTINNNSTSASKATSTHNNNKSKEEKKASSSNDTLSPDPTTMPAAAANSLTASLVKEEIKNEEFNRDKQMEMDDRHHHNSYRPTLPPDSTFNHTQSDKDFFADLGEIEADPLHLLLSQAGFSGDNPHHDHDHKLNKALDPFSLFDWSEDENNAHDNI